MTHTSAAGYRVLYIDGRSKYEHRHVMEELLGRSLDPSEHVHHIDGDPLNNKPSNLFGPLSASDHAKLHGHGGDWGQADKTHCKWGHAFDDANTYMDLSEGFNHRMCRACRNQWQREYRRKKKAMA